MKRTWTYLAFLPFTAAMDLTGAKADEMGKAGAWGEAEESQEEESGVGSSDESSEDGGAGGAPSGPDVLSFGGAADEGSGLGSGSGFNTALDTGYMSPIAPSIVHDGSMYMSASGGAAAFHGSVGGVSMRASESFGGEVRTIQKVGYSKDKGVGGGPLNDHPPVHNAPAPDDITLDDSGYVEADPEDADAMMILLGGLAEGVGDGAAATGEVVFDIVDYGAITIGYGYAFYGASGAEEAFADTFATVSGADLVFSFEDEGSSGPIAYSTTHVIAIDFEGEFEPATHPDLGEVFWGQLLAEEPFTHWDIEGEGEVSTDGNTAMLSFSADVPDLDSMSVAEFAAFALDNIGSSVHFSLRTGKSELDLIGEAQGVETLVSANGSVIETTDQFSSVTGIVVGVA